MAEDVSRIDFSHLKSSFSSWDVQWNEVLELNMPKYNWIPRWGLLWPCLINVTQGERQTHAYRAHTLHAHSREAETKISTPAPTPALVLVLNWRVITMAGKWMRLRSHSLMARASRMGVVVWLWTKDGVGGRKWRWVDSWCNAGGVCADYFRAVGLLIKAKACTPGRSSAFGLCLMSR